MNFSIGIYSCPMDPIHLVGLNTTRLTVFRWKARGYDWILVNSIGQPSAGNVLSPRSSQRVVHCHLSIHCVPCVTKCLLRTVPTIVTARFFAHAKVVARDATEKCATRRTRGLVLSPVSLGASSYFWWKRCIFFQQMKK